MSTHAHPNGHSNNHQRHSHPDDSDLAQMLELDALVLGSYLEQATQWAATLALTTPGTIVDVGAGSGAGSLALARRFPNASIIAVDKSTDMLATTLEAARNHSFSDRVSAVEADLDQSWPAITSTDLMWASSSLHELLDPARTMADMFSSLKSGGLLVVIEMDSLPRFLPANVLPGLETRLHAALAQQGWNAYPNWRTVLVKAGFDVLEHRSFPTSARSTPELATRYARTFLGRIRQSLEGIASPGDLAALDILLADHGPESLHERTDLQVRGSRTAWAARKP